MIVQAPSHVSSLAKFALHPGGDKCRPVGGEYLYNFTFDCGVDGWSFDPAYPADITDNGDGSVHLQTQSNFGSLVPNDDVFPSASWVLKCKVRNVNGTGKMSIRLPNGTWVNSAEYTADGEYTMHYTGAISEIHVGASSDPNYSADYEYISLRQELPNSIIHDNELVTYNGNQLIHTP